MNIEFKDLIGKTLLAGFTYYNDKNEVVELKQKFGAVQKADRNGLTVLSPDGEEFCLPPDLRSTEKAAPGCYKLRTTGEVINDPDFISTWSVRKE